MRALLMLSACSAVLVVKQPITLCAPKEGIGTGMEALFPKVY